MATRNVATVFGGSGFIGRYVVKRLAHKGFVVRVAVRDPEAALFLKTAGAVGQVVPLFASVENEAHGASRGGRRRAGGQPGRHPGGGPRGRLPAHPCRGRRTRGASGGGGRGGAAGAPLGDRRRPGQPEPLRRQQGGGRAGGAGGVPGRDHPAPLDRVRPGGQVLQPLRRDGAAVAGDAGDLPARPGCSRSMSATWRTP